MFQRKKGLLEDIFTSRNPSLKVDKKQNIMAMIVPAVDNSKSVGFGEANSGNSGDVVVLRSNYDHEEVSMKDRLIQQVVVIRDRVGDESFRRHVESLNEKQLMSIIKMSECVDPVRGS